MTLAVFNNLLKKLSKNHCRRSFSLAKNCKTLHITKKMASTEANPTIPTVEDLDKALRILAPSLNAPGNHKGTSGKVAVIGGSFEYTGAPYFASISALKVGADLVHVFCMKDAAIPIKCYSPELIVHPLLHHEHFEDIKVWLKSMDVILVGCGMGRKQETFVLIEQLLQFIQTIGKPLVIDADGLFLVKEKPDLLKPFKSPVILTPNRMELSRFVNASDPNAVTESDTMQYMQKQQWGPNITMLVKAKDDMAVNCLNSLVFTGLLGSGRRCGGQGDILGGSLAIFLRWSFRRPLAINQNLLACYAASKLTRECNRKAYARKGRSMTAGDMIDEIQSVFCQYFETDY